MRPFSLFKKNSIYYLIIVMVLTLSPTPAVAAERDLRLVPFGADNRNRCHYPCGYALNGT